MTPEEFTEAVREANRTALSRLGSSKSLYADTMGDMETDAVLGAAADAEHYAAETYATWAESEADSAVAEAFETTASEEREHYETVAGKLDEHEPSDEVPTIHEYLRALEDTVERVGGFVGRTLAAEASKSQTTGFFVGQADPQTAQSFRDMGEDLDAQLERALDLLAEHCESDGDWERAEEAAGEAIGTAYDEYTERLEGMGVNPKPVC
ncbi:MAG: rubrerythrin family protein [Haloarculaceae archaeon]